MNFNIFKKFDLFGSWYKIATMRKTFPSMQHATMVFVTATSIKIIGEYFLTRPDFRVVLISVMVEASFARVNIRPGGIVYVPLKRTFQSLKRHLKLIYVKVNLFDFTCFFVDTSQMNV